MMMKIKNMLVTAFAVSVVIVSPLMAPPVWAHHSHAMFEMDQEVTVTGTVAGVRFANPHVFLLLERLDDNGQAALWTVEMSTVSNMIRRGVASNTFHVGDAVTITMNPLRNGQSGGNYTRIESINGAPNSASGSNWSP